MGTNFYFRNVREYEDSQGELKRVKEKIREIMKDIKEVIEDDSKIKKIEIYLESGVEDRFGHEELHIGKRSVGWKPSFKVQEYYTSVKELEEFYKKTKGDYEIIDEYGRVYDWEDLEEGLLYWNPEGKESLWGAYKDDEGYVWKREEFS